MLAAEDAEAVGLESNSTFKPRVPIVVKPPAAAGVTEAMLSKPELVVTRRAAVVRSPSLEL